jgi:hypothetical protein
MRPNLIAKCSGVSPFIAVFTFAPLLGPCGFPEEENSGKDVDTFPPEMPHKY